MAQLVRAPVRKAGDPGYNPGPGENFSLKLSIKFLFIKPSRCLSDRPANRCVREVAVS